MTCEDTIIYRTGDDHITYRRLDIYRHVQAAISWLEGRACQGDFLAVDLPNSPEFLWMLLACAHSGIPFVALNHRLTAEGKKVRLDQLKGVASHILTFGIEQADRLKCDLSPCLSDDLPRDWTPLSVLQTAPQNATALVLFTSGTTGTPKAAALTWGQMLASAAASNQSLVCDKTSLWQAALPLYHVGGLQVVFRSWVAHRPCLLYQRFDAAALLDDAAAYPVTHASVVDKMLQDFLRADAENDHSRLTRYQCLLLGGAAPNRRMLAEAIAAGARVYASFGMTETCSQIANVLVDDTFDGGAELMPHAEARIVDPDENGVGALTVRGPSVLTCYLNAPTPRTPDGFFITGDRASLRGRRLYLHARTADLIISGGENIYPAEVETAINQVPSVTASYVFGVPDDTWGQRPVALVESAENPEAIRHRVQTHIEQALPAFSRPRTIVVVPRIPLQGIGKIDRPAARTLFFDKTPSSAPAPAGRGWKSRTPGERADTRSTYRGPVASEKS